MIERLGIDESISFDNMRRKEGIDWRKVLLLHLICMLNQPIIIGVGYENKRKAMENNVTVEKQCCKGINVSLRGTFTYVFFLHFVYLSYHHHNHHYHQHCDYDGHIFLRSRFMYHYKMF